MLWSDQLLKLGPHQAVVPTEQTQNLLQDSRWNAGRVGNRLTVLARHIRELLLNVERQMPARVTTGTAVVTPLQEGAQLESQETNMLGVPAAASYDEAPAASHGGAQAPRSPSLVILVLCRRCPLVYQATRDSTRFHPVMAIRRRGALLQGSRITSGRLVGSRSGRWGLSDTRHPRLRRDNLQERLPGRRSALVPPAPA
jgi:hypothetical protein